MAFVILTAAALASLGPGRGEWMVEPAEQHGISSAALDAAAARIKVEANERCKCLPPCSRSGVSNHTYTANTTTTTTTAAATATAAAALTTAATAATAAGSAAAVVDKGEGYCVAS